MRTLYLSLLAAALMIMALPTHTYAQANQKIAFVDMEQVFGDYYETKRYDKRLQAQLDDVKAENDEMVAEMQELEDDLNVLKDEVRDASLSDDARKRKRTEAEEKLLDLRKMQEDIIGFQKERRADLDGQGRRIRERIVKKIDRVIRDYAHENALFAVFDSSGGSLNQIPLVVFSDSRADVTDEIVAILNEGHEEEVEAAKEAEAEEDEAGEEGESIMDEPVEPDPGE